jgi:hypothetical protein
MWWSHFFVKSIAWLAALVLLVAAIMKASRGTSLLLAFGDELSGSELFIQLGVMFLVLVEILAALLLLRYYASRRVLVASSLLFLTFVVFNAASLWNGEGQCSCFGNATFSLIGVGLVDLVCFGGLSFGAFATTDDNNSIDLIGSFGRSFCCMALLVCTFAAIDVSGSRARLLGTPLVAYAPGQGSNEPSRRVWLANRSYIPLSLDGVENNCAAVVAEQFPVTLAARARVVLDIAVRPGGDSTRHHLFLYTNYPGCPIFRLSL